MKNIFLSATAMVALSTTVYAGEIYAPTEAPLAGWEVTASGNVTVFGYARTGPTSSGVSADFDFSINAEKALDNGDLIGINAEFSTYDIKQGDFYLKSESLGEFRIGYIDESDHGVKVPYEPFWVSIGGWGDLTFMRDGEQGLTFASANLSKYQDMQRSTSAYFPAITYASPELSGLQLGLGTDNGGNVEAVLAGELEISDTKLKFGTSYDGNSADLALGNVNVGLVATANGYMLGGSVKHDLGTNTTLLNIGVAYNAEEGNELSPIMVAVEYNAWPTALDEGNLYGTLQYKTDDQLKIIASGFYEFANNSYDAAAGAISTMGAVSLGVTTRYSSSKNTNRVSAGADFALSDSITIGVGVGYDGTDAGSAAGMKYSF